MIRKRIKNSKGFMSIEAIIAMGVVLMVIVLGIGFFTYMMPKQAIEQEVNLLGRMAKMNGGLTAGDMANFKETMEENLKYTQSDIDIEVMAINSSGAKQLAPTVICKDVAGVACPAGTPYVKRNEQKIIEITVTMPAKNQGLLAALSFFNANKDKAEQGYVFKERVMSERY